MSGLHCRTALKSQKQLFAQFFRTTILFFNSSFLKTLGNSTVSVPDSVFKIYFGIKGSKTYIHAVKFPNTRVKIKSSNVLIEHGVKNLKELESISGTIFPDSLMDNHNLNLCEHFKCTIDEELLENMEKLHEDL